MKWAVMLILVTAGLGLGWQPERETDASATVKVGPRFEAVDLFVDSGEVPLGAYQIEVKAGAPADARALPPKVTLVGVEGGSHDAFKDPPRYDPKALHEGQLQDRIILAAFNTGADLPKGKTRVARIHVQAEGVAPVYSVVVMAAAAADGTRINATATGETR